MNEHLVTTLVFRFDDGDQVHVDVRGQNSLHESLRSKNITGISVSSKVELREVDCVTRELRVEEKPS